MTGFLDLADALLAEQVASLGEDFRGRVLAYVLPQQHPGGGFPAPSGTAPDLYYTDFAVRLMHLLHAPAEPLRLAAEWAIGQQPASLVEVFNLHNICRLAEAPGALPGESEPVPIINAAALDGAYDLFLWSLICSMRREPAPEFKSVLLLEREDGGYAESPQGKYSQTNATAAALSLLWGRDGVAERIERGCRYLKARQTAAGGFSAFAAPPLGSEPPCDLLSTFSSLLALAMLGQQEQVNLSAAARFLRDCARPSGGFAASAQPSAAADLEYTYYGVATAALLRSTTPSVRPTAL